MAKVIEKRICQQCGIEFIRTLNTRGLYCNQKCSQIASRVRHHVKCKSCGKDFFINNIAEIKRGHYQFCSTQCGNRKYKVNELFFEKINNNTAYWIGFIWATVNKFDYRSIRLLSDYHLLENLNKALSAEYPIRKSNNNKYKVTIFSTKILSDLVDIGISNKLDFPNIPNIYENDFIRGYFDSDSGFVYKENGINVSVIHSRHSKLIRNISEKLNCRLSDNLGEWVAVSFDLDKKIDGFPKLETKWEKFKEPVLT